MTREQLGSIPLRRSFLTDRRFPGSARRQRAARPVTSTSSGPDRLRRRSADADVVFVGEQPGDQEDLRRAAIRRARRSGPGRGPCRCGDRPLAGLRRRTPSSTSSGSRGASGGSTMRSGRPNRAAERSEAPRAVPGSRAELAVVKPDVLVCLGATADALACPRLGRSVPLSTKMRERSAARCARSGSLAPNVVARPCIRRRSSGRRTKGRGRRRCGTSIREPESRRETDQVALSASRSSAGSVTGARQAKLSQT